MIANYHTHTSRCGHATGEDREYVEAAIRSGIRILGFSDHCPWVFKDGYVSGTRMLPSRLDDYFSSIERLKREYSGQITIYTGFEAEYNPELMQLQDELLSQYPIDYLILGEHFISPGAEEGYTGWPTDRVEELVRYVDLVIEGMETGRYAYIAHPDLINFIGSDEIYEREMRRICEYCKAHDKPIEVNMLGLVGKRHYPSDRFFRIAQEVGNKAIVGCDAHSPDQLEHAEGIRLCEEYAARYGLPLVDILPDLGEKRAK